MKTIKAVVFDIDGTLTRDISWVRLTAEVGGSIEYNDEVFKLWTQGKMSKAEAMKSLVDNWSNGGKGFHKDFLTIFNEISVREDALETISYLKDKGYKMCMITGSFDLYVQTVSERLGISQWYAIAKLQWDENRKLISIEMEASTDETAAKTKIEFFKKFCDEHNLKPEECVPVGDSRNDMALFQLTRNGIVVRTEFEAKELEAIAWKKINHLAELKNIL